MPYCTKCGAFHNEDEKFCTKCGNKLNEHRSKYYTGDLHKCPNCGEMINTFEAKCSICGYEIRGTKCSQAVIDFSKKLEELEKKRSNMTLLDNFKKMINSSNLDSIEEQIISHITNFPIPNNKEDIFEFAILASSNIDAKVVDEEDELESSYHKALNSAWRAKFSQAYKKAKAFFPEDEEFKQIQTLVHEQTKVKENKEKSKLIITLSVIIGIVLIAGLALLFGYLGNRNTDPNAFKIGCSSDALKGENYQDVYDILESKGFTNIRFNDLNDLNDFTEWFYDDGEVKSVSIGGDDDFSKHKYFTSDEVVVITYHSYPDE